MGVLGALRLTLGAADAINAIYILLIRIRIMSYPYYYYPVVKSEWKWKLRFSRRPKSASKKMQM